jgi:hypothetical protein
MINPSYPLTIRLNGEVQYTCDRCGKTNTKQWNKNYFCNGCKDKAKAHRAAKKF